MKEIKVGIIGFGTVGAGVADCLLKNADVISKRTEVCLKLAKIADLDIVTDRGVVVPKEVLTTSVEELIKEVDIVVELVGGTTIAKKFILDSLNAGKPVITANKALLAEHGEELFAAAEKSSVDIYYEASVAGGIPVIKALREGLSANRIERIYGIMNGTCNYILTRMENEGIGFETILKDAQELGYAEAEPSLDVDGVDTAHKTAILTALAYGEWIGMEPICVEGIRDITLDDIKIADEMGYRIKLLAIMKQVEGNIQARVHPTLIPKSSLLGNVSGVFNAVMITGDVVDDTLYYGKGAGRDATASAVVADIVDVALNLKHNCVHRVPAFRVGKQFNKFNSISEIETEFYIRLSVEDKPGVIAEISEILSLNNISISSFVQKDGDDDTRKKLVILTHSVQEEYLRNVIVKIEKLSIVNDKAQVIRIEQI